MKILLLILVVTALIDTSIAQNRKAFKIDTYVENKETDLASLEQKARAFAAQLRRFPTSIGIVFFYTSMGEKNVNFCTKNKLTAEKRADYLRNLLIGREHLGNKRIVLIDGYLRSSTELDLWVVPKGTVRPEATPTRHIDCSCAGIAVNGPADPFDSKEVLTFSADVSGGIGDAVTYKWNVLGGRIISGQGTPSIKVKVIRSALKQVTATVNVKGANGCCQYCNERASFTTKVSQR
jgi:hypothetical protein